MHISVGRGYRFPAMHLGGIALGDLAIACRLGRRLWRSPADRAEAECGTGPCPLGLGDRRRRLGGLMQPTCIAWAA